MRINWNDVWQAVFDVRYELLFTLIILALLTLVGLIIFVFSSWLNHQANRTHASEQETQLNPRFPSTNRVLANRKSEITITSWRQQQQQLVNTPEIQPIPFDKIKPRSQWLGWWANFWQGMSTEFFGAVVTTVFLGVMLLVAQQYQFIRNHKLELILQMGSPDNATAIEATRQLHSYGWLRDGTLFNRSFHAANLQSANLFGVDLTYSYLEDINLSGADLRYAILSHSTMWDANLADADLSNANLKDADLSRADLANAIVRYADLTNVNLTGANLTNAILGETHFNEGVLLPDAKLLRDENGNFFHLPESFWTPETNMRRYTDSEYSNYWNPCAEIVPLLWYCESE